MPSSCMISAPSAHVFQKKSVYITHQSRNSHVDNMHCRLHRTTRTGQLRLADFDIDAEERAGMKHQAVDALLQLNTTVQVEILPKG